MSRTMTIAIQTQKLLIGRMFLRLGRAVSSVIVAALLLIAPSLSYAEPQPYDWCNGVCEEDDADVVWACFYFLEDPCDWYDGWPNK